MTRSIAQFPAHQSMHLLSRLLLQRQQDRTFLPESDPIPELVRLGREEFDDLTELADLNHVVVRGLTEIVSLLAGEDAACAEWAEKAIGVEKARIATAIDFLHEICAAFAQCQYEVTVIKSLDHWPDLGSDLDLYTNANPEDVLKLMKQRFNAQVDSRSWGDRLACKWNFLVPGLPESVEIHMGRLGQTGEQVAIAGSLTKSSRLVRIEGRDFRVPSISDRLMISTLQRMYRHFYFRLCDIIDTVRLADGGEIDYEHLRFWANEAGIWKGVATYLAIVSDYARSYRGAGIELPQFVSSAAQFGGSELHYARGFLRVPILPQSARLYGSQLADMLGRGELHNGARLSLLPWLATAAVVGQKLTGSDKGIW